MSRKLPAYQGTINLFSTVVLRATLVLQRTLEKEIKGCKHLILWTDGDREGENIAEEIANVCSHG